MAAHRPWRVAFEAIDSTQVEIVNVFHILDTTPLSADLRSSSDMCDEIDSWLSTLWRACAPSSVTLTDIKVTEEVDPASGDIPDQHVKTINLAGTGAASDAKLANAACVWSKASTGVPVRGAHGGWHGPPARSSANLDAAGLWAAGTTHWIAIGAFNTALLAGHDYAAGLGHLSYIIYSRTRRKRGESTYYFDVSGMTRSAVVHYLRSRLTAP